MSKRIFNEAQIKELLANPNVSRCSDKSISYSKEFKVSAMKKYHEEGYSPKMIFEEAGFDIITIGKKTPKRCLAGWKRIYNARGIDRLKIETRGKRNKGGKPRIKKFSDKERMERMEIEIAYLKAENDFLAKLRAAKKR